MKENFPLISDFCRLYWGQLAIDVYGSLEGAFGEMLADAEKLSDGGISFKRALLEELILLDSSFEELSMVGPNGRYLDFKKAYLFRQDVKVLKGIMLSQLSGKDS